MEERIEKLEKEIENPCPLLKNGGLKIIKIK